MGFHKEVAVVDEIGYGQNASAEPSERAIVFDVQGHALVVGDQALRNVLRDDWGGIIISIFCTARDLYIIYYSLSQATPPLTGSFPYDSRL